MRNSGTNAKSGFSLVELAIVLSIVAVVVGMSVSAGMTQLEIANNSSTKENLELLRTALENYKKKHERYPCPADGSDVPSDTTTYGYEVAGGCDAACPASLSCPAGTNAVIGVVPFATLGVNRKTATDAWDHKITYIVDKNHTGTSEYQLGSIVIQDGSGNEVTASPDMGDAIFVLISHGVTGSGAWSAKLGTKATCTAGTMDEENCDITDAIFVDARFNNSDTLANFFDDIVVWKTQEDKDFD